MIQKNRKKSLASDHDWSTCSSATCKAKNKQSWWSKLNSTQKHVCHCIKQSNKAIGKHNQLFFRWDLWCWWFCFLSWVLEQHNLLWFSSTIIIVIRNAQFFMFLLQLRFMSIYSSKNFWVSYYLGTSTSLIVFLKLQILNLMEPEQEKVPRVFASTYV